MHTPEIYNSDPRLKRLQHISIAKCAIHFLQKELPAMLGHVDYLGVQDIMNAHSGFTNVAMNVSDVPVW